MKLTILGTGNALVTECYNTCFALQDGDEVFLVDGGGGSTILTRLKQAGIDIGSIHTIFVTHKHIDHILGIIWMIRIIGQKMNGGKYDGNVIIYAHDEVKALLYEMAEKLLQPKEVRLIGDRIILHEVKDGEAYEIIGCRTTFFDIGSTKAKQFGFMMELPGGDKFTCCGDEPYNECEERYAKGSKWLLHEAFCLYSQAAVFKPYEKHHSTVKDACELAEKLGVSNLILYHTEDSNIKDRKRLYSEEGRKYYNGNLYIPEDLETFDI